MILQEVLLANRFFVREYDHRRARTLHHTPRKKVAVFTCMDTRLVEFLEPALGIKRGDAKIIKNAGNRIRPGCDDVIRSLAAAVFLLEVKEILVIGHLDCGMSRVTREALVRRMCEYGIPPEEIAKGDLMEWIGAFGDTEENVREAVVTIKNHPLIPGVVPVHGLVFDPESGEVRVIVNGYETGEKANQKHQAVFETA